MLSSPRAAVSAAFLIHSTVSGTWAPRLPAIKESLGLSDGELGTALVGLAIGLLVGIFVMIPGLQIIGSALLCIPFRGNIPVAALMTFGRLSQDNEITALRASGVRRGSITTRRAPFFWASWM